MSITPFFHVYHKYVFIMTNISKIKISGTSYSIKDENACKVVELTQAQYDDLPTSAKTSNSLFVITDAEAGDLSNYYTKSETSGATEISTALASKADTATTYTKTETDNAITAATSTKQDTLVSGTNIKTINNQSILGEGNIEIQGGSGGGKAINAGTNISITTGETADTINCTLPITAGTNSNGKGIIIGDSECTAKGLYAISLGHSSDAGGNYSFCNGSNSSANGSMSFSYGNGCNSMYDYTLMFGFSNSSTKSQQYSFGGSLKPKNELEFSFGRYNKSYSASTTFGHSGNTMFSIGNGYDFSSTHNFHNAFEVRQNGDIYIANTNDTSITGDKAYSLYPMIKLQDALGGGGGGSSYTAGDGIDINNDVISVTGKIDTSAITTSISSSSTDSQVPSAKAVYDKLDGLKLKKITQSEYDSLSTKDNSTLYVIVN